MQAPAKPAKTTAATRRPDGTIVTADQIKQAQQALVDKGLYKGKVTGRLNRDFRKAVKDFQTQNQLKATGRLNQETLAKLNIH
jgi:peptidoglycan hydrolase-like protein with peptidoglycan-binding domain